MKGTNSHTGLTARAGQHAELRAHAARLGYDVEDSGGIWTIAETPTGFPLWRTDSYESAYAWIMGGIHAAERQSLYIQERERWHRGTPK